MSQSSLRSRDLLAYYRELCEQTLTVVDLETTGSVGSSRVIEVSILQASLKHGIQQQVTHLINPQVPVPSVITWLTGINQTMIDTALPPTDVWLECLPLLEVGVLTAHNLAFDYGFLQSEYGIMGVPFRRPLHLQLCTVLLARLLLPELRSRALQALVTHFGFDVGRSHRAESDTLACWLLAKQLLRQVQNQDDETLLALFAEQWVSANHAATILNCPLDKVSAIAKKAKLKSKYSQHRKTNLYRRGDIENLIESEQMSLSF
jgi:DNA polymerase III subunit epsilon